MGVIKGQLETTISLNKSTCYFLRTGKCSLNIISDYFVASSTRNAPSDLLYCPRLFRAMCNREREKPVTIIPCKCGHVEVTSGQQRACIASQKQIEIAVEIADNSKAQECCTVCGGQLTFEENTGGDRIVTIKAIVKKED